MVVKLGLAAVLFVLSSGLAAMGWHLMSAPTRSPSACPADHGDTGARAAMAAYSSIEADLARGSIANVGLRARFIADFFEPLNTEISGSARRLATLKDLAEARMEFARLTRFFIPSSERPGPTPPRA